MSNIRLISAAVLVLATTTFASAENDTRVRSSADALANAQSAAGSISQSNNQVIFNSSERSHSTVEYRGDYTVRSAPQVAAPSMSSGHPCAYAPLSIGVSVVGFGGAFGGQRVDDACLLAQMGVRGAAISMIAARNPSACRALAAAGQIPVEACGGSRRYQAVAAPRASSPTFAARRAPQQITSTSVVGAPRLTIPRGSVKCIKNKAGKVIKIQHWARVSESAARSFCRQ